MWNVKVGDALCEVVWTGLGRVKNKRMCAWDAASGLVSAKMKD